MSADWRQRWLDEVPPASCGSWRENAYGSVAGVDGTGSRLLVSNIARAARSPYQTNVRVGDHPAREFSKPLRIGRTKMPTLKDAEFGPEPSEVSGTEASGAAARTAQPLALGI